MQDPGHLIATYFILLYTILGPLVLFAFYVLFDSLATPDGPKRKQLNTATKKNDPALWTKEDIDVHLNRI